MVKIFLLLGSIFAALSVVLGAFASHALQNKLTPQALNIWETGTKYQMYHALALVGVALLLVNLEEPSNTLNLAGISFLGGMILFSGSLYVLSLSGTKIFGAITPLGGIAFIFGWLCLAIASWSKF